MKKILTLFFVMIFVFNISVAKEGHHPTVHAAAFLGATSNFHTEHTDISVGADIEFPLPFMDYLFGIGLFGEYVFADHAETLVGVPIFVHPMGGWKIWAAPGMAFASESTSTTEDETHKGKINSLLSEETTETVSHFMVRVGTGYDFHIGKISLTPSASADYINGHVALVYGLSLGIGF